MSVLACGTNANDNFHLFAGGYVASGGMSSNVSFAGAINNLTTSNIFNLNSNLMPEVGKSYLMSVCAGVTAMTGAGTGANAFVNIGLQYDSGVVNNSAVAQAIVNPGSGFGVVTLTDIFQRVASPAVPLRLILGNYTGSNITAGTLRIIAVNVVEVPSPVVLGDAQLNP